MGFFLGKVMCIGVMLLPVFSCSKKTMNDRDVRKEQLRINAHKKRLELAPLVGTYRGSMMDVSGYKQDVVIQLAVKDVPETEGGQVDPVLMPIVNGALSLTYGGGNDMELLNFGVTKADYNATESKLDMVVTNTQFKEVNLSLLLDNQHLSGSWSSPSSSISGEISLVRTNELKLGGETPAIGGVYQGIFDWKDAAFYTRSELTFTTAQDTADVFHISAHLKVQHVNALANEKFLYEFENVEFNPLSRQISLRNDKSDIYFVGVLAGKTITGTWGSKRSGALGKATFSNSDLVVPTDRKLNPVASGVWFAKVKNLTPATQMPERLMLNFNAIPDATQNGGLTLNGNTRLYFGSFSSNEYLEYRFEFIDYQPFARKIVAVTQGNPKLTMSIDLTSEHTLVGKISDASLGEVASFEGGRQPTADTSDPTLALSGIHKGYFEYDTLDSYQEVQINLVPSMSPTGIKLAASLLMFYGKQELNEALSYQFDDVEFNSLTGLLTIDKPSSDVVLKANIKNGNITGEWFSKSIGRMGKVFLSRSGNTPTDGQRRLDRLRGNYRGTLVSTPSGTNLPERIMFGLVTTLDSSVSHGLRVTGNLRLYVGRFESNEFVELPFETVQFDPFRRTISGKTSGQLKLTVQGVVSSDNRISGTLSDDSLGVVGTFEVQP